MDLEKYGMMGVYLDFEPHFPGVVAISFPNESNYVFILNQAKLPYLVHRALTARNCVKIGSDIQLGMNIMRQRRMIHTATNCVFDINESISQTSGWFNSDSEWEAVEPNMGALLKFHKPEGLDRYLCLHTFSDLDINSILKNDYDKAISSFEIYHAHQGCSCHPNGFTKRHFDWRECNRMIAEYSVNRATWALSSYFLASYYRRSFLLRDSPNPNLLLDVVRDAKNILGVDDFSL